MFCKLLSSTSQLPTLLLLGIQTLFSSLIPHLSSLILKKSTPHSHHLPL